MDDPTAREDAIYTQIRTEIRFEIELMSARVNWLITSQAFLFVPLMIGAQGRPLSQNPLFPLIPCMGIVLCILVMVGITAAAWRCTQWRTKMRAAPHSRIEAHGTFSITAPDEPLIPVLGYIGVYGVPLALMSTWIYVLATQ